MIKRFKENLTLKGIWKITVRDKAGNIVSQKTIHNIIPTISRQQVAKALANELSTLPEIVINFQELGTGTTAPTNSDTGLETPEPSTRKILTSSASQLNQLNLTAFWAAGEATGTHEEFSLFMNGTASSNSGILFNRVLLSGVVVGASNSLTLDGTVILS